jgi:hypothetical protein
MMDTKAHTAEGEVRRHLTMSLDSHAAGAIHELDWMAGTNLPRLVDESVPATGASC